MAEISVFLSTYTKWHTYPILFSQNKVKTDKIYN